MVPPTDKKLKATESSVLRGVEGAVLKAEAARPKRADKLPTEGRPCA